MKQIGKVLFLAMSGVAAWASDVSDEYSWGNVVFEGGGYVDGIITSKTQENLIYARTDVGGAYRWDPADGKWIPLLDWVPEQSRGLLGTEALALDPQNPNRVYISAGISYFDEGKSMILRSDDYGESFDTINVTSWFKIHGNGMGRGAGERLAVDPQNGDVLFCGTRTSGLFKSEDRGDTWTLVSGTEKIAGTSLVDNAGITYILFDTAGGKASNGITKNIYMGVALSGFSPLYKSTDGGETFSAVDGGPSQMAMRAVIADGVLYGTFNDGPGPFNLHGGSIYKYELSSGAWTDITPHIDSSGVDLGAYASGHESYQYGFGGISVDPNNSKRLVASTSSYYGGGNVWEDGSTNAGDEIFISDDGGETWRTTMSWSVVNRAANGNGWIGGGNLHWASSVEFNPFDSKQVWSGSGNGVFRTDDVDASVPMWTFLSKGIEETVPLEAVSVPGGPLVTAIMDYDGATYDDILTSAPVHSNPEGSSGALGFAFQAGYFIRSGKKTFYDVEPSVTSILLQYSKDMGKTWTILDTNSIPGAVGTTLGGLAMSTDGSVMLVRPDGNYAKLGFNGNTFYRSTDEGKTWTAAEGLSAQNGLMVADGQNPDKFYILPDGYNPDFYRSEDGGATFEKVVNLNDAAACEGGEPYYCYSASNGMLRVNPYAEGDLWVCLDAEQSWTSSGYSSNGLAHSTDGGSTWTRLHTMDACLSIGLGKAAPGADYPTLYMWGVANGGARGVYRSIDKGETWERINDDKHQYGGPANGKFVVGDWNVYGRVYMSTAGRGLVYGNIGELEPMAIPHRPVARAVSAGMRLENRTLFVSAYGLQNGKLQLFGINGKLLSSFSVSGNRTVDLRNFRSGTYVARLTGSQGISNTRKILLK